MLTWVVQNNLGKDDDVGRIFAACSRLGLECIGVKAIPFSDELPDVPTDGQTIFYGATRFTNCIAKSGLWTPGVFYDEEKFSFPCWREKYGEDCLNHDGEVMTLKDLHRRAKIVWAEQQKRFHAGRPLFVAVPADELFFARPVADDKSFSGEVFTPSDYLDWYKGVLDAGWGVKPDTKAVVSSPKNIQHEWRVWIVNGRAIEGTLYRYESRLQPERELPKTVREEAERIAAKWSPALVFCLDLCTHTGFGIKVVEVTTFNSAGFYAADIDEIVEKVSEAT